MRKRTVERRPRAPDTGSAEIMRLRARLDRLNLELLRLLELRGRTVRQVMSVKQRLQIARYDGTREQQMMETLLGAATGVYTDAVLVEVFKAIFAACRELQPEDPPASPSRKAGRKRTRVSSGRGH